MTLDHNGRVALITGANRGIGYETAKQLARRGFHVIIAARDHGSGLKAAQTMQAAGGKASSLTIDVDSSASIQSAASQFAAITDRLDVLINNAAIYPDEGLDIVTVSREHMIRTFQTNTFGALEVTQAFLPPLRKAAPARVINLSSGYGQLEGLSPGVPSYCLSKLALNGLTIMLASGLKADGVAVNSVCPGWVRTEMGGPSATRSAEEGADTVVWLADDASHKVTGKFFRDRHEVPW